MKNRVLKPVKKGLTGTLSIPGDKSISHRSIILGSLADGRTTVENFLTGEDCLHTIKAFQEMAVDIQVDGTNVVINSKGIDRLKEPLVPLYFGNSGTTARLMLGLLAGLPFFTTIWGDPYLTQRPMNRVIDPLKEMSANIVGRNEGSLLPLSLIGGTLSSIHYKLPVKSAQVKSAILLAGLLAKGTTTIVEMTKTRDHTENMLKAFGADLTVDGNEVTITGKNKLQPIDVFVPGDISSAAFFLVAGAIVPGSVVKLKDIGLNDTRAGIIDILQAMGARLYIEHIREKSGEKFADIIIEGSALIGTTISGDIIPRLIDEIPVIALLATQAKGKTIICDAEELRVKETDRIAAIEDVLTTLGARVETTIDGMVIYGEQTLTGGSIRAYHDHRIAMMAAVASLITSESVTIDDVSSVSISYPNFFEHLEEISE